VLPRPAHEDDAAGLAAVPLRVACLQVSDMSRARMPLPWGARMRSRGMHACAVPNMFGMRLLRTFKPAGCCTT
jgi:hypothetical protein